MKHILVCEDELPIREFVVINLKRKGYAVSEAGDAETALSLYRAHSDSIDMALLDVMLPEMDGFALCRALRSLDPSMGIIMLTARSRESEKIGALHDGADDYITKPFSPSELLARIESLYRRMNVSARHPEETVIRSDSFALNMRSHTLFCGDTPIELTQVEFGIMEYFLSHPGQLLTRTDILHRVWGESYCGEEKIVDVNIRRLRMKVEQNPSEPTHILTEWGKGYRWNG